MQRSGNGCKVFDEMSNAKNCCVSSAKVTGGHSVALAVFEGSGVTPLEEEAI